MHNPELSRHLYDKIDGKYFNFYWRLFKMIDKNELREALKIAVFRKPDALIVLSVVSCISEDKIISFVNGHDDALSMVELMTLDVMK